jgi:hypothetical protein
MWQALARQCRERGDLHLAAEAEALARTYQQHSTGTKGNALTRAA